MTKAFTISPAITIVYGLVLLLFSTQAAAHQQGSSYSQWQLVDGVAKSVTVKISALDLTRVGIHPGSHSSDDLAHYLQSRLLLDGCEAQRATVTNVKTGWYSVSWPWRCRANVEPTVTANILADVAPNHLHFARWQDVAGKSVDILLNRDRREVSLVDKTKAVPTGIAAYFSLGVGHIFSGYDHLAFLLGLLLLARRKQLLWLITGFTVGHSLTLGLASSGWLQPNSGFIEAAIAWSIALLAAELYWRRNPQPWPWLLPILLLTLAVGRLPLLLLLGLALFTLGYALALAASGGRAGNRLMIIVTLAFGLIHGCGFASILAESGSGNIALPALFGFNLGIEAGQLLLVALALPIAWLLRRWRKTIAQCLTHLLMVVACYWWLLRI